MADSSLQDLRASSSAMYSTFRRKLKGSRSSTASSLGQDSVSSFSTGVTSDDSVPTLSTAATSVVSIPATKDEVKDSVTTESSELPTKESTRAAVYAAMRSKLRGSRSQASSSLGQESESGEPPVEIFSESVSPTHADPAPSTTAIEDEIDQSITALPPIDELPTAEDGISAPDAAPQEVRSKRAAVYAAFRGKLRGSRSQTDPSAGQELEASEPAELNSFIDALPAAEDGANGLTTAALVDSPPASETGFVGLTAVDSSDQVPPLKDDSMDSTPPEGRSTRAAVYGALRNKLRGSSFQTASYFEKGLETSGPPAANSDDPLTSADEGRDLAAATRTESIPAAEVPAGEAENSAVCQLVAATKDGTSQKEVSIEKVDHVLKSVGSEIDVTKIPDVQTLLAEVQLFDITENIICDFDYGKIAGTGGFGNVYVGTLTIHLENGETKEIQVAVKCFRVHIVREKEKFFVKTFTKEIKVWSKLNHPNILPFRGFFLKGPHASLVSEWMDNGSSLQYIKDHPECDLMAFSRGIAEGLKYVHDQGVIHSDIKSENILVSSTGAPQITDFGMSFIVLSSESLTSSTAGMKGSLRWMAPELIKGVKHNVETDIWAFGMVVYEFIAKEYPYANMQNEVQVIETIKKGIHPVPTSICPEAPISISVLSNLSASAKDLWSPGIPPFEKPLEIRLWNLCKKCWEKEPKARIPMFSIIDYLDRRYVEKSNILDAGKVPFDTAAYVEQIQDESFSDKVLEEKIRKKRRDLMMKSAGLIGLAPTIIAGIPGAVGAAVTARRVQISRQKLALLEREWTRRGNAPVS